MGGGGGGHLVYLLCGVVNDKVLTIRAWFVILGVRKLLNGIYVILNICLCVYCVQCVHLCVWCWDAVHHV